MQENNGCKPLLNIELYVSQKAYQYALKGEALEYIYALLAKKQARDVYVDFIMNHTEMYYGKLPWYSNCREEYNDNWVVRSRKHSWKYHAELSTDKMLLMYNVLKGIPLMIEQRDSRAEDVALHILQNLPYRPDSSSCFILFSTGWRPNLIEYSNKLVGKVIQKEKCRIVAMRYLHQLNSRKAIPDLEKLLNSPNPDERDFALATLEEIASGGSDITTFTSEILEEDKYDKIVLRNGDTITGKIMNASLHLKTSYGAPEFQTSTISYIKLEGADSKTDALELRNGDRLTGSLNDENFTIALKAGQIMAIKKKDIASITFRRFWQTE